MDPAPVPKGQWQDIVPALREAWKVIWEKVICLGFMGDIWQAVADILGKDQKGYIE